MKDLIIVGAGGFGREVYGYALSCIENGANWRVKGFLDDNPNALNPYNYPLGIIGSISEWRPSAGELYIMGLGAPKEKKRIAEFLMSRGAEFTTLIHPLAYIGRNVKMGKACIICPFCVLNCDLELGDFVTVNTNSALGHDARIGSWCTLSSHSDITGRVSLGEGVFFSSSVTTVPSAKIGDWCNVGINSSVIGRIKPNTKVFGNPASEI